jgi:hypothetical protein
MAMDDRQISAAERVMLYRWASWAEFLVDQDMTPFLRTCDREGMDARKVTLILEQAMRDIRALRRTG